MKGFSKGLMAVILGVGLMGFIGHDFLTPVKCYSEEKKAIKAEKATKETKAATSKEPIRIGVLQEQTGSLGWYGTDVTNVAKMWAGEVNKGGGIGGREVKLFFHDTQSDAQNTITGFNKLVQRDKVHAILGPSLVGDALAIEGRVAESGPIMYCTSGGYTPKNKFIFAGQVYRKDVLEKMIRWYKEKGITAVAFVSTNNETGQQGSVELKEVAKPLGVEVVAEEYFNPDDVDVTGQFRKVLNQNPGAIVAWTTGRPAAVAIRAAYQLGMNVPMCVSHGNLTRSFLAQIKGITPAKLFIPGNKDMAPNEIPADDPQKPVIDKIHKLYVSSWGAEPGSAVGTAWDGLEILRQAFEKVGTEPSKMVSYIEGISNYVGATGIFKFSPTDHRGIHADAIIVLHIRDGQFKLAR